MANRVATQTDVDTFSGWIDDNILPIHGPDSGMKVGDWIMDDFDDSKYIQLQNMPSWVFDSYTGAASGNNSGDPDYVVTTTISGLPSEGWIGIDNGTGYDEYKYSSYSGNTFTLDATEHPGGLTKNYNSSETVYASKARIGFNIWIDAVGFGMDINDPVNTFVWIAVINSPNGSAPWKYISTVDNKITVRPLRGLVGLKGNSSSGRVFELHGFEHLELNGETVSHPGLSNPWKDTEKFLHGTFGILLWDADVQATHMMEWVPGYPTTKPSFSSFGVESFGGFSGWRLSKGGTSDGSSQTLHGPLTICRNYRHDAVDGEGIYAGHTGGDDKPYWEEIYFEDNIFARCATEAIQIQHQINSAAMKSYRNNILVGNGADWLQPFQPNQDGGIQIVTGDGGVDIENNIIEMWNGTGYILLGTDLGNGQGRIVMHNNLWINAGRMMYIHNSTSGAGLGGMVMEWQRNYFKNWIDRGYERAHYDAKGDLISNQLGDITIKFKNFITDSSPPLRYYDESDFDTVDDIVDDTLPDPAYNNPGLKYGKTNGDYDFLGRFGTSIYPRDEGERDITSIVDNGGFARISVGGGHRANVGDSLIIHGITSYDGFHQDAVTSIVDYNTMDTNIPYNGGGSANNAIEIPPVYYQGEIVSVDVSGQCLGFYKCKTDGFEPTAYDYSPANDPTNWEEILWDSSGVRSDDVSYSGTPDPRTGGHFPPDDFRLTAGSFYEKLGIGLTHNFTTREKYQWEVSDDGSTNWRDVLDIQAKRQNFERGISGKYYRCKHTENGTVRYSNVIQKI